MRRCAGLVLLAVLIAACDGKPKDSTVDITRGGTKAIDRAKDVSKVLEQGAARAREAEDASGDPMKKGY
jgi:hypothetical protein